MDILFEQVLSEPVVVKLLKEAGGVLNLSPPQVKDFEKKICTFVTEIFQIARDLPFCSQESESNQYWKDAWLQWLGGIEKHPRFIRLVDEQVNFLHLARMSANALRGYLQLLARTVVIITGLLEAEVSPELYYT